MIYSYNDQLNFGQYEGLRIKEIYQGTLNLNENLLTEYLEHILNQGKRDIGLLRESEFIERFEVKNRVIKIIGEAHDMNKPLSPSNRIVLGNIWITRSKQCHPFRFG